ncbi:MAG: Ribosomal large subunit pseudouridine synthase B [Paracidovorax wautersii]|uniref:Pseudouridine synthase n=1 Tax=Paracidovorax wautersii TaxID=1177982 RepID=A0A7V8JRH4_9BURK|nr:MAG: Ribosomal large subunit pseudouridine synthase B [Paracidovorax wautersii]
MNDENTTPSLPGFDSGQPDADQPAKAPRKPRARKTAAADAAVETAAPASAESASVPAAEAASAAASADGEAKPKRTRRPRKAVADEGVYQDGAAADAVAQPAAAEWSPPPVAEEPKVAFAAAESDEGQASAAPAESGDERSQGPGKRRRKLRSKYGVGGADRRKPRDDDAAEHEGADQAEDADGAAFEHAATAGEAVPPTLFADVISGQFDADEADESLPPPKRALQPQPETPKLHKVLAQAGMGSRLEMEQMITEGKISVNNEPAHVGQRIQFGDQIKVNGKVIRVRIAPPPPRVLAYHKPVGEVVTHDDPQNRPTVFRRLPKLYQGKWQSVGRLDLNTEGLLLFTSSGELANRLMHPRFGLQREYAVRVLGALSQEEKQQLLDGVRLDDGMAQFQSIEEGGGDGANCWYRVTIAEGRNREVRRMIESVGHAVSRLIRIRYGAMVLPRGLKRGAWIELDDREIRALTQASGGPLSSESISQPTGNRQGRGGNNRQGGRGGRNNKAQGGGGQPAGERFDDNRPPKARQGNNNHGGGNHGGYGGGNHGGNGGGGNGGNGTRQDGRRGGNKGNRGNGQNPDQNNQPRGEQPEKQPTADAYMQSRSLAQIRGARRRGFGNDGMPGGRGDGQPDPMRTSVGYIGADSFSRAGSGFGGQRRGGGGGGGYGGGGNGGRGGRGGRSR